MPAKSMPGIKRKFADDRGLAGDREAVLVIDRRMLDGDGDVALHQIGLGQLDKGDLLAGLGLLRPEWREMFVIVLTSFDSLWLDCSVKAMGRPRAGPVIAPSHMTLAPRTIVP